jgi:branched-chain amino acid transport system permease protein
MSGVLAGVASLFYLSKGSVVTPTIGDGIMLFAFVAIVLGGMGSLLGAALGGLLLGFMSSFLQVFLPDDIVPFRDALLFGVVILTLLIRPQGLIAVRGNEERV